MSVQGTILVLDGTSTNRIMLKVQLTAAWYHVVQAEKLHGLAGLLRRTRPDLVLVAQSLPDGSAADVKRMMAADPELADVPVVAIAPRSDKAARLQALSDGLDDVLTAPFKDTLLLARIRSLLRARADTQELQLGNGSHPIGFAESAAVSIAPPKSAHVAILTHGSGTGVLWQSALSGRSRHNLSAHRASNMRALLSGPVPDAILIELGTGTAGLNTLADLKSRGATRHTVLIAVLEDEDTAMACEALDRGADAVCMGGFCADEVQLHLENQIARKVRRDQMRASLKRGLAESWVDPLTGLHNRRYAMQAMDQMARQPSRSGYGFVVMLADLDHFKTINDRFGHVSGDRVLAEAARRMKHTVGAAGFVARIGGEEFMIGLPDSSPAAAMELAKTLRDCICEAPFSLPDTSAPVPVTISIGLAAPDAPLPRSEPVERLLKSADTALYAAKKAGRNQVRIRQTAA
ncbi:diguanylate cyclase [Ruegeria atlantica]|uniref:diguanylate cyclase n=1 Tax=Ruegeria atlantica TaxID=81569 RepID=UPI00147BCF65|nr:diguanylate cyclase [Ruegeria atlantica]